MTSSPTGSSAGPSNSSAPAAVTTVSGVIVEGIAPACRVLDTGHGKWALAGAGVLDLREGDHVQVSGRHHPELVNRCGRVFVVESLTRTG